MKLQEILLEPNGTNQQLQLGRLADGLSVVYAENGGGKSNVCQLIRQTLFGRNQNVAHWPNGRLRARADHRFVEFYRDASNRLCVLDLNRNRLAESVGELAGWIVPSNLSSEVYDAFYNVSFRDTLARSSSVALTLQNFFDVPTGSQAFGNEMAYRNWHNESTALRSRLEVLQTRIQSLMSEKNDCLRRIESIRLNHRSELAEVERQISQVADRLSEIGIGNLHNQLLTVENELSELRLTVEAAKTRVAHIPPVPQAGEHSSLYNQLDEIDSQIRRWRHVQSEIQQQRIRLRDEMLVLNEMTLESDSHPYHNARAILVSLESKVDQAERQARLWGDVSDGRLDTNLLTTTLQHICRDMRKDVYDLCNELGQQYKFIRHKSAAAELRQLRRCYTEMGESIKRLVQKREASLKEIARIDPAGADAIVRADLKFCQCAQHEGYLEARRKFVGSDSVSIQPTYEVVKSNVDAELARIQHLESQRAELNLVIRNLENETVELERRHAELLQQRDLMLVNVGHEWNIKIEAIDLELQQLTLEQHELERQLENGVMLIPPNALLSRASELLAQVSGGDLTQVFLNDSPGEPGLLVRDQFGKVLTFSAIEAGLQDQAYLTLILAVREQLVRSQVELPTVIDDCFLRIPADRVTSTLRLLKDFGDAGHQLIAMTQHRYLVDRVAGVPLFELSPTIPFTPAYPERDRQEPAPLPTLPPRESGLSAPGEMDIAAEHYQSQVPRAYPLSKYPRSQPDYPQDDRGYTITYPFTPSDAESMELTSAENLIPRSAQDRVRQFGPAPVSQLRDTAIVTASIDDQTPIDQVAIFDASQLRILADAGIVNVGDFLSIDSSTMGSELGFLPDQIGQLQSQVWLLSNVPGLRVIDSQILVACGVIEPEQLETSNDQQLFERISRFLASHDGRRYASRATGLNLARIHGWQTSIQRTRSRWQHRSRSTHESRTRDYRPNLPRESRDYRDRDRERASQERQPREVRPPRMHAAGTNQADRIRPEPKPRVVAAEKPRAVRTTRTKSNAPAKKSKLKFYLDLSDHIEAAPSIGPKTAERFEKIGVHTVADFLKQTSESMANKIAYKRITENLVRQWQHQARFVCRVPNLRGHDAQLLVACGITEAEELSTMQPAELFKIIEPFANSKEGLKIIRNGKLPDLEEITDWITWAQDTRSLQAA